MAEQIVQVTEGSGKKLHTWERTIGANTVQDEVVLLGEPYLATYSVAHSGVSWGTASAHVLQIMAGSTLTVRVHRIMLSTSGATATGSIRISCLRLTTAGTGGTTLTPRPYQTTDAASGATAMQLPSTPGTEGVLLWSVVFGFPDALARTYEHNWIASPNIKPIYIPAGTSNGIVLKTSGGLTITGDIHVELTEANF